jgi:hypothetical protein
VKLLENHHAVLTIFIALLVLGLAVGGGYLAYKAGSAASLAGIIGAAMTSLTGLHAGSSAVAISPNTPPWPPAGASPPPTLPPGPPTH